MIFRTLAAVALAASAAAAGPVARDSDEFAYHVGGKQYFLGRALEEAMFADAEVVAQFRRIGLEPACGIYNRHLRPILARHEPEFRPLLIGAIRSQVPAEILLGSRPLALEMGPIQSRKGRIIAELERSGAALFAKAGGQFRAAFLKDAASAPAAGPASSGVFDDWDLEKPLARRTACMVLRVGPPDNLMDRKRPFDQFYLRGDSR